jgi:hypothetical protein
MTLILNGTDGLSDIDGSAATPAIRGTDANTGMFFPAADTIAFSEGGTEVARFDSSGNLGIGTSSPTGKLDVVGDGVFRGNQGFTTAAFVYSYAGGTNGQVRSGVQLDGTNQQMLLFTGSNERARIDSSGNLLVGTTSNTSTVGVAIRNAYDSAATSVFGKNNGAGDNRYITFFYGGAERGYISYNGSGGINYYSASDYRLKEEIAPMTGALAKVAALKPVTYKWKESGKQSEGFIAHELAEVCPDAVAYEKDAVDADGNPQYQGIDTSFLVATLTAAIQEQQAMIEELKAKVAALEAKG